MGTPLERHPTYVDGGALVCQRVWSILESDRDACGSIPEQGRTSYNVIRTVGSWADMPGVAGGPPEPGEVLGSDPITMIDAGFDGDLCPSVTLIRTTGCRAGDAAHLCD